MEFAPNRVALGDESALGTSESNLRASAALPGFIIDDAMVQAIAAAERGPAWGLNPRVGAVILDSAGNLLATGWHRGVGTAHAEVDALNQLPSGAREHLADATLVVTLEPCNHSGHTGPCSEAVIAAGIGRIVYALSDPGKSSGGGAERLAQAGVTVERYTGEHAGAAAELIHRWYTSVSQSRPYFTVKWASSLDGRIAAADGTSQWITGPAARTDTHLRRSEADAILVGTGTLLADDPALTARDADGNLLPHQPVPVVVGRREVPAGALLRQHPNPLVQHDGTDVHELARTLFDAGVRHAFVEGGPTLISALIGADLVDEAVIYLAPTLLGGPFSALANVGVGSIDQQKRLTLVSSTQLGEDIRIVARFARDTDTVQGAHSAQKVGH